MRPSAYNFLFLIVSLTCPGSYSLSLMKERTGKKGNDETFAHYDWELKVTNVMGIYTSNAQKFMFLSHKSEDSSYADITLAYTSSTPIRSKTCLRRIRNTYGQTVYTTISNPYNEVVRVSYTADEVRHKGWGWSGNIDMSQCGDTTKRSQSDTPDTPDTDNESTVEQLEAELITSNVEASNNETEPADAETNGVFENIRIDREKMMSNVREKRMTWTNGKIGTCWKEDIDVICLQVRGVDKIMNYTRLELPAPADWFGVHNLKGAAMLVLTSDCPNGQCEKITVRKIEAGDKVSKIRDFEGVDIECAKPSELTVDVADDSASNKSCFTFVCSHKNSANRGILQYRKHCINALE